jgi:enoyl-CoA hydratase/carnithine racemase
MGKDILIKEIANNVGTLKFNRLEQRNALSIDLLMDLHRTL